MTLPRWKYSASVYTKRDHCTIYRDDALGVQKQVMEKKDWLLLRPKERIFFFIDGDKRTYRSEPNFLRHLLQHMAAQRQRPQGHQAVNPRFAWE